MSELTRMSALELADLLGKGAVSSEEVVRAYLARIERLNPLLSAFVEVQPERALRDARARDAERRRARGARLPPFHGVPTGIKDLNMVRGMRTRFGSRSFGWLWSPVDDLTTRQIRRAGFVILGKLTTSELGAMPITEPEIHPPTRNPWNPEHTAGGSSGGSGAAVAADLLPIAQGSDGAGSIRIPSSFCHLVGHKPSRGRLANSYGFADRRLIYTTGALARTVDDAAAMLDAMAGISVGRPHWAPPPSRPFAELARRVPARGLRIHVALRTHIGPTDPEVEAAVARVVRELEQMGHIVEEGRIPQFGVDDFLPIWQHAIAHVPLANWDRVAPVTRWLADAGRRLAPADVARRQWHLESLVREAWGDADFWITPTVAVPPPRIGELAHQDPGEVFRRAAVLGAFTATYNLTGQPSVSVPIGLTSTGLPIGVQIGGRDFADGPVLALARVVEQTVASRPTPPLG